jgi:hypothetical protein
MSDQVANVKSGDPRNYQLPGRVSLFFRKAGSLLETDWREFGNIIAPVITPLIERLDHHSLRRGTRGKDRSLVSQRGATLNFSADEINLTNLKFMFGSTATPVDKVIAVNDGKIVTNPGGTAPDNTVDLKSTDLVPGSVVVKSAHLELVDEVTYVETVDYTINNASGILTILPGGALNVNDVLIPGGVDEIHVFFRKDAEGQQFEIFSGAEIEGQARFQVLTKGGAQYVVDLLNVSVRNNGDFTIGDGTTWQEIPLSLEILEDENGELGRITLIKQDELD